MKKSRSTITLVSILLFCNSLLAQDYVPTKESVPNINRYKASYLFIEALNKCENNFYWKKWWESGWSEWGKYMKMKLVSIPKSVDSNVVLEFHPTYYPDKLLEKDKPNKIYNIYFSKLQIPTLELGQRKGVQLGFQIGKQELWVLGGNYEAAKQLLDAVFILKNKDQKTEDQKELESFKPIAEQYKSLSSKPQLNEEARKYLIQANSATEEKRYMDGIDLLEKALAVDQAYPLAHFNRALLWAQVSVYGAAVLEMKKYLMLVPNAEDARASQDKIYEWEGKIK